MFSVLKQFLRFQQQLKNCLKNWR